MNREIKKGDEIMINRGILGLEFGTFLNTKGWSIGGFWGEYKNAMGEIRLWDETVDRLKLLKGESK